MTEGSRKPSIAASRLQFVEVVDGGGRRVARPGETVKLPGSNGEIFHVTSGLNSGQGRSKDSVVQYDQEGQVIGLWRGRKINPGLFGLRRGAPLGLRSVFEGQGEE